MGAESSRERGAAPATRPGRSDLPYAQPRHGQRVDDHAVAQRERLVQPLVSEAEALVKSDRARIVGIDGECDALRPVGEGGWLRRVRMSGGLLWPAFAAIPSVGGVPAR